MTNQEYVKQCKDNTQNQLQITYPYEEPSDFTIQFHGWCRDKFPKESRYLTPKVEDASKILAELLKTEYLKDVLLSENVPKHLDRTMLETYLSEDEFRESFQMKKSDYQALPVWKRETLRKKAGFF